MKDLLKVSEHYALTAEKESRHKSFNIFLVSSTVLFFGGLLVLIAFLSVNQ